ncbi:MAG TPA: hypothetical protein VLA93_07955 [Pyrinomonadaceae bacterium]|nr:hypothetical protein [Pyrinomonadaceae bacterium]
MKMRKPLGVMITAILFALVFVIAAAPASAQIPTPTLDSEANLDTQLYLIVGTNQDVDDSRMPTSLDSVIKQLRASLPFKNYRLAATLVNRVKNDGRLDLRWIGGPFATPSGAASAGTPSFSEFKVGSVKLMRNADGQPVVHMLRFSFGARIPIQTGTQAAASGAGGFPVINYENTGINTDISLREGEPVVVGTLNAGPSGDAIILVVSAKRTNR